MDAGEKRIRKIVYKLKIKDRMGVWRWRD